MNPPQKSHESVSIPQPNLFYRVGAATAAFEVSCSSRNGLQPQFEAAKERATEASTPQVIVNRR